MSSTQIIPNKALVAQAASLAAQGMGIAAIAREMKLTAPQVKKLIDQPEFKTLCDSIADESVYMAVQTARSQMQRLMGKAIKVIEVHLDEDSLEAARDVIKMSGLLNKDDKSVEPTQIQVFLPGSDPKPITIEVQDAYTVQDPASGAGLEPPADPQPTPKEASGSPAKLRGTRAKKGPSDH